MWLRTATVSPRSAQCVFRLGEHRLPHTRDPGGSPFQTPTRLADGLGHGSDLVHGYPWPFAPSPDLRPGNLGPPHWPSGRKANLGCIYCQMNHRTPGQFVKRPQVAAIVTCGCGGIRAILPEKPRGARRVSRPICRRTGADQSPFAVAASGYVAIRTAIPREKIPDITIAPRAG